MNKFSRKIVLLGFLICLIIIGVSVPSSAASLNSRLTNRLSLSKTPDSTINPIQFTLIDTRVIDSPSQLYLPLIITNDLISTIELSNAWTGDISGSELITFAPGDFVAYHASGSNSDENPIQVSLNWSQDGPCGSTTIYSDTVNLASGEWEHSYSGIVPDCIGVYTNTLQINENGFESSLSTQFLVNSSSSVVVGSGQAFDRCYLPSLELMQAWWDNSPYSVFNIYIGGVSFFCTDEQVDAFWLHAAAQQGWSFIPTWVGPQAPCSKFTHRMSSNASVAYQEGRAEADAAHEAAELLGFLGDQIIYYDVEGYPDECRAVVDSFLLGWVERLHELGVRAGVYGSPCRSYISDWDDNESKPDNVWIAHWYTDRYDPNASVFGTPCLPDTLWPDHQRLKQYARPHTETWGGLSLNIDSNVLDGEIYGFLTSISDGFSLSSPLGDPNSDIRDMALLSPVHGWALKGERLFGTSDGGQHWREITPKPEEDGQILAVTFLDHQLGWLLHQSNLVEGQGELTLLNTVDAGVTWQEIAFQDLTSGNALPIGAATLEFIDAQTGWVSLKLQSSSNFSLGRLFATQDGGRAWQERTIPFGEPVRFIDADRGWTAGGPSGDQLYRTLDGGETWQPEELPIPDSQPDIHALVGLPRFYNDQIGILPVTMADSTNSRLELYISENRGDTWDLETTLDLKLDVEPAETLPFSLNDVGKWWVASQGKENLYTSSNPEHHATPLKPTGLPAGVVSLDFFSDQIGWALVQEGNCHGHKSTIWETHPSDFEPLQCFMQTRLFSTQDGGVSWDVISLP